MAIDTETVNAILALLEAEIRKYPADSEASIALWKFKELLDNDGKELA